MGQILGILDLSTYLTSEKLMTYLAIVKVENNRIAKYQDYDSKSDADTHVDKYGGFVVEAPKSGSIYYWVVNEDAQTITHDAITETADKAAYDALAYSRSRKEEYDKLNQFELIGEDSINGTTNHRDAILAIKEKYPKE